MIVCVCVCVWERERIKRNIQKEGINHKHTSQWETSSKLTIVQLVQNHFKTSTGFCNGSQSLSSSSSSSNRFWLSYISWKVSSFGRLAFFCKEIKLDSRFDQLQMEHSTTLPYPKWDWCIYLSTYTYNIRLWARNYIFWRTAGQSS